MEEFDKEEPSHPSVNKIPVFLQTVGLAWSWRVA